MAAAVILAAGAASRMGRLKQLLPFRGQTLLENAIRQARDAGCSPIAVVVGAQAELVMPVAECAGAIAAVNTEWQSGMGSSVRVGVSRVLALDPSADAVVMMLADQPYVSAQHLKDMLKEFHRSGVQILAASYSGTLGVPAIFNRSLFDKLTTLAPDAGAKTLLRGDVARFELPDAAIDIDTPEDFAALS